MIQASHGDLGTLLSARADATPDRVAYRFLGDTAGPTACTYAELARAVVTIAAAIRAGRSRGERVLLLYPPGLEFIEAFLACVGAGAIAVPAPPPNPIKPKQSLQRLVCIVESARPTFALTLSSVLAAVGPVVGDLPAFAGIRWIATDELLRTSTERAPLEASPSDAIALIQYTSGSTSDPKGAALSHRNVLENVDCFDVGWTHDPDSLIVNWLPAFHDLGLVYGILAPLRYGVTGVQMSPLDVIQRPASWLRAISAHRATHSCGPNFIYDLCTKKISDAECAGIDLASWRVALTAAEPVHAETLTRFSARFAQYGFRSRTFCPGYGLSEATCKVVATRAEDDPVVLTVRADMLERHLVERAPPGAGARAVVACGRPDAGVSVRIVDPETRTPVAPNAVGEVWVAGHGVAQSYWENPSATADSLRAKLNGDDPQPYLRTGDLGFVHDGQLFVTGRLKDTIIVRGANHYPQDIEYTAQEAHAAVRAGCCAAFSYEEGGEERLAVVLEVDTRSANFDADQVIAAVTKAIAEGHGLRAHRVAVIRAGTIPKTTSGKIQRRACRRALFDGALDIIASEDGELAGSPKVARSELRARVVDVVSGIGAIRKERIRTDQSLHSLGVDSLAGVNIAYEIGLMTGHDVPSELLTEHDTVEKLVDYVISLGGIR